MNTLAFDGRTGASGDMIVSALLAAGGDPDALAPVEDALAVRYEIDETLEHGIAATTIDVVLTSDGDSDLPENHEDHGGHAEGGGPTRTYAEVVDIVSSMDLPADVEEDVLAIVDLLGDAEAAVHGGDRTEAAFHEVGADDAIADVVGATLLIHDLGVDRVVTTPVSVGGGEVETSHGRYPVPVPAVAALLERADWAVRGGPIDRELLTPTGAAILAHFAEGVTELPSLSIRESGYGAGSYEFPDRPNVLRALIGDERGGLTREEITVLETNLDDATPEVLGGLQETLLSAGARDVTILPTTMKKSRPGHLVKVIVRPEDAQRVARKLAMETGTLGIREHGPGHRWVAQRSIESAVLSIPDDGDGETYEIDVKVARDASGEVYDVSAEYDDALAVATETGLPVREVLRLAEDEIRDQI